MYFVFQIHCRIKLPLIFLHPFNIFFYFTRIHRSRESLVQLQDGKGYLLLLEELWRILVLKTVFKHLIWRLSRCCCMYFFSDCFLHFVHWTDNLVFFLIKPVFKRLKYCRKAFCRTLTGKLGSLEHLTTLSNNIFGSNRRQYGVHSFSNTLVNSVIET